ncbi:hemerythrin domain-containing protein [Pseudoroseicyclus tamaricis]|uniref:Hemerythrin domain-containing protein n=1 Tax=Pseudoroseicyclus tamaricis TaxID=2705421 RepID=A0A6B2JFU3_9RHOB|nr:hemerythrin domain-containing protein [Pseudoroseicyclus tamaricis]NDU99942.1 hemerythrin domain-containing protein [Pseudoroseicyclus tamaricis]
MAEEITLPDPATRPEAPKLENVTPQQKMPGQHLKMIHDHQRRNMEVLRQIVLAARDGGLPEGGAEVALDKVGWVKNLRRFGALCGQHCQIVHMHHSIEDAHMFPALSQKAVAFRAVVQRLGEEHDAVHHLLMQLIDELNALNANPSQQKFEAAVATNTRLEAFLLSHLGYEEDSIGDALGVFNIGV